MEATPTSKSAWISEELCIGCGICVKVSRQHAYHPETCSMQLIRLGGLFWICGLRSCLACSLCLQQGASSVACLAASLKIGGHLTQPVDRLAA